jgi:hypothetical protein
VIRRAFDQLIVWIARIASRGFYRKVETAGFDRLDTRRPTLIVANHFNGFADPVLVTDALGQLPRFLAKATLWKVIVVRPLLAFAGVIPIHRQVDGEAGAKNRRAFEDAGRSSSQGMIAIPQDDPRHPRLAPIRTARPRSARAQLCDIRSCLSGWFEDKIALRSRARARAGRSTWITEFVLPAGARLRTRITSQCGPHGEITERLRGVTGPTFLGGAWRSRGLRTSPSARDARPPERAAGDSRPPLGWPTQPHGVASRRELGRYSLPSGPGCDGPGARARADADQLVQALWLASECVARAVRDAGVLINAVPACSSSSPAWR